MSRPRYFIHDWQELHDQVRRMRASFTIVRVSADGVLRSKRRIRFFNIHSPATEALAIELIDSVFQLIIPLQDYEPNPSGPTRFVIGHDLGRLDWVSVRFKPILKIGIRNFERQVSDE